MISVIKNVDIFSDWQIRSSWTAPDETVLLSLATLANTDAGIDLGDVLTTNTLGLSRSDILHLVLRKPVMGRDLFSLMVDFMNRLPGPLHADSRAVAGFLTDAGLDVPITWDDLIPVRESSKRAFPPKFRPQTQVAANASSYISYMAALSLEEHMFRGPDRAWRGDFYAQSAMWALANRVEVVDAEAERQWMIDRVATYLP